MATSGPGATNFVTCLADAKMDSIPIIAITGQVGTPVIGTDAFQETPIVEVCRAITKHHYLVHAHRRHCPRHERGVLHRQHRPARPGDRGRAQGHADAADHRARLGSADEPARLQARPPRQPGRARTRPRCHPPEPAADHLCRRRHHRLGAAPYLKAFAERTGIPVALTLHGLGGFPSEHFLCLQMLGMHGTVYANYAINEADLLLALGVRFDDRVTGKVSEFAKHGKIVHIDIDPSEINKNKAAHIPDRRRRRPGPAGPAPARGRGTADVDRRASTLRRLDPADRTMARERAAALSPTATTPSCPSMPSNGSGKSSRTAASSTIPIVTTGVGQHQMWAAQYCHFNSHGTGSPAAGSAPWALACPPPWAPRRPIPDKTVIDIDGDGSFLMNIQELACCFTEKLPVKVLLLNNQHLGMVVQWEDRFHGGNRGHTYLGAGHDEEPYPDFVTMAKGFRCGASRISQQGRPRRRPRRDARQQGPVRARRAWSPTRNTCCR